MRSNPSFLMYRVIQEIKEVVNIYYPGKFSMFDYFVLQHINSCNAEGCTQYQLAKTMRVSSARVNPAIKKLTDDNMISVRVDNSSVRIKKIITLTETGKETVNNIESKASSLIENADKETNPRYDDYHAFTLFLSYLDKKLAP